MLSSANLKSKRTTGPEPQGPEKPTAAQADQPDVADAATVEGTPIVEKVETKPVELPDKSTDAPVADAKPTEAEALACQEASGEKNEPSEEKKEDASEEKPADEAASKKRSFAEISNLSEAKEGEPAAEDGGIKKLKVDSPAKIEKLPEAEDDKPKEDAPSKKVEDPPIALDNAEEKATEVLPAEDKAEVDPVNELIQSPEGTGDEHKKSEEPAATGSNEEASIDLEDMLFAAHNADSSSEEAPKKTEQTTAAEPEAKIEKAEADEPKADKPEEPAAASSEEAPKTALEPTEAPAKTD